MTARLPLNKGATVTVPASGNASIRLGPGRGGPRQWGVTRAVVRSSTPGTPPVPRCSLYLDSEDPANLLDVTYDGSYDATDFPGDGLTVFNGGALLAVWTGASPGVTVTLSINGWQVNP